MINRKSNDMQAINSAQIRAARAMLKITAQELADAAGVGVATVRRAESGDSGIPTKVVAQAIRAALEAAGIAFVGQSGVRLAKVAIRWNDDRTLWDCFDSIAQERFYLVTEMLEHDGVAPPDAVSPRTTDLGQAERWLSIGGWQERHG